jgi:RNA 3'-terminal phosphate cyclase
LDPRLLVRAASAVAEAARLCEGAVCGAASGGKSASGMPGGVAGVGLRTTVDDASSILTLDDPSLASASGCAMGAEANGPSRSTR